MSNFKFIYFCICIPFTILTSISLLYFGLCDDDETNNDDQQKTWTDYFLSFSTAIPTTQDRYLTKAKEIFCPGIKTYKYILLLIIDFITEISFFILCQALKFTGFILDNIYQFYCLLQKYLSSYFTDGYISDLYLTVIALFIIGIILYSMIHILYNMLLKLFTWLISNTKPTNQHSRELSKYNDRQLSRNDHLECNALRQSTRVWSKYILPAVCMLLVVSFIWEYVRLYQIAVAEKATIIFKGLPPECLPGEMMSYWHATKSWLSWQLSWEHKSICDQYHKALLVDPLWEVNPLMVLPSLISRIIALTMEISSSSIGKSFGKFFTEIPLVWQPFLLPAVIVTVLLSIVMCCGYTIHVPFFLKIKPTPRQPVCNKCNGSIKNHNSGDNQYRCKSDNSNNKSSYKFGYSNDDCDGKKYDTEYKKSGLNSCYQNNISKSNRSTCSTDSNVSIKSEHDKNGNRNLSNSISSNRYKNLNEICKSEKVDKICDSMSDRYKQSLEKRIISKSTKKTILSDSTNKW